MNPEPAAVAHQGHVHQGHAHLVEPAGRFSRFAFRLWSRAPRSTAPALVLLCFFGGVAYTIAAQPTSAGAFESPTCLVKLATGFDCPGCGGTRAFWYLLHGNVAAAARSHIIVVFAAPYLAYMYVAWTVGLVFRTKRLPLLRPSPMAISVFLAAWGVFSILRNLPWAPFTWFFV